MIGDVRIVQGRNDTLVASDGTEYLDLVSGFGAVLLGHGSPAVLESVHAQVDEVWLAGRLAVPVVEEAADLVNAAIEGPYRVVQFYSSGNEAVEFAIRLASVATGRTGFIGFSRSMHGKSTAASAMCWDNALIDLSGFHTLAFVGSRTEQEILEELTKRLASRDIAAVFVEPIQGSSGGLEASPDFYRAVCEACREHGSLCVFDEVLTGFYRAGSYSYCRERGISPDAIILGKAMGNGFPVAAVMCREGLDVDPAMLPGSTFSNSPLAAAAVAGTLKEMRRVDMAQMVRTIDNAVREQFDQICAKGATLRGNGALWIIQLPERCAASIVQREALSAKVLVSVQDRLVRLFPAATMTAGNLDRALEVVSSGCLRVMDA